MIFRSIFKPKWQHRDPQVRKKALLALPNNTVEDAAEIVSVIAQQDDDPELRRLAIEKLCDLEVLHQINRLDPDAEVRQVGGRRLVQLLCGKVQDAPEYGMRLRAVEALSDRPILEQVAINGQEPQLRLEAMKRVENEALLGKLAANDRALEVRLSALERISDQVVLEKVIRLTRKRDKRIHRLAQERLDQLREELERPIRLRQQREALCAKLEKLSCELDVGATLATSLERIEQQWEEAQGPPQDTELNARWSKAREALLAIIEDQREKEREQARQEAETAELRAQKKHLCETLEKLTQQLGNREALDTLDEASIESILKVTEQRWRESPSLTQEEENPLQAHFEQAFQEVQVRRQALSEQRTYDAELSKICTHVETLAKTKEALQEKQVRKLEQRWDTLLREAPLPPEGELQRRFAAGQVDLHRRLQEQREQRGPNLERLESLVSELDAVLENGEVQHADSLLRQAHHLIKRLGGYAPKRVAKLDKRLHAASAQLHELHDWQRWANTQEKERLCKEMETLLNSNEHPEELARRIREARAAWKTFEPSEPTSRETLWERFNTACNRAYEPCKAYFDSQARQRERHFEERQRLCEQLESLVAQTDWEGPDWKELEKTVRQVHKAWRQIGPIDRKYRTKLEKRFRAVVETMEQHLNEERERNRQRKERLIEQVESLREITHLHQAVEEAKQAQNEWKELGPAQRRHDHKLWKRFHAACNEIFERRKQQREALEADLRANLEQKEALCAMIERLAAGELSEEVLPQVRKAESEWRTLGPVPRAEQQAAEQRFTLACAGFDRAYHDYLEGLRQEQLERLQHKAELCMQVEALAQGADPASASVQLEAIEKAWQAFPALEDAAIEQRITERFERACNLVLEGGEERWVRLEREQQANLATKERLCIRMEVVAGVDSPADCAQARLEYQVARLSEVMGHGGGNMEDMESEDEAHELACEWLLCGPVPSAPMQALNERFARARQALMQ